MNYFGFGAKVIEYIKSYLADRTQVMGKIWTALMRVRSVPEGSYLGPTGFNLYTSDFAFYIIPLFGHSCKHLYADDFQLHLFNNPDLIQDAIILDQLGPWQYFGEWSET